MSLNFIHETLPQRVVFASHEAARHVAAEVARLGNRPVPHAKTHAVVLPEVLAFNAPRRAWSGLAWSGEELK